MSRQRKILLVVVSLVVVICTGLGSLRLAAGRIVEARTARFLREACGLDFASAEPELEFLAGRARIQDVRISQGGTPVLEAEAVEIRASFLDLLRGRYDIDELRMMRPNLHVVVERGSRTNLARIFSPRARSHAGRGVAWQVFFHDARIEDGRCSFDDEVTDPEHPARLVFDEIDVALTEVQVGGDQAPSELGDLRLDAYLIQEENPVRISVVGWTPALRTPLTLALHVAVTGLDLGRFPQYSKRGVRTALGGDVLDLTGTLRAQDGKIVDGAIAADVEATGDRISLRFGGSLSDIVFDENSRLAALVHLPFARLGSLGDVAVTSTWKAAGELGRSVVESGTRVAEGIGGTLEGMGRLDPLGALRAAGGGVLEGARTLGGGIVGATRKILGLPNAEDRSQEREYELDRLAMLHADRRRAMLEAAAASAEHSSLARQRRIRDELARPNAGEVARRADEAP